MKRVNEKKTTTTVTQNRLPALNLMYDLCLTTRLVAHMHASTQRSVSVWSARGRVMWRINGQRKWKDERKRIGGAERESIKKRKALEESVDKCCKMTPAKVMVKCLKKDTR